MYRNHDLTHSRSKTTSLPMARSSTSRASDRRRLPNRKMCARTHRMRQVNLVIFYFLVMLICSVTVVTALPQFKQLEKMEGELSEVQQHEQRAKDRQDQQFREYKALEQDSEFLEIIARDRLDLYREGETIFRFSRD